MMLDLSKFSTKEELFDHLHRNKPMLVAQKKSEVKRADTVSFCISKCDTESRDVAEKSGTSTEELLALDKIRIIPVINTTNLFDSHHDVHIDNLWKKTLKEQEVFYLVKEHKFDFDNTLSDEVDAYVKTMTWKSLGYGWEGSTQALIFDTILHKKVNEKMFEMYAKRKVRNHSVGMQYVKLHLAINSKDSQYKEEKEVWDKYHGIIANKKDVDEVGYFWAVTEAKIIEGSAVMRGSNFATPTLDVTEAKGFEPPSSTRVNDDGEPPTGTRNIFKQMGLKIK